MLVDKIKKLNFNQVFPAAFVGFLFVLNVLPLIAPILAYFGERNISGFIYWMYSFTCHQKSSRSIFICDHQYGWCARCTFLWFTTFISSLVIFYPWKGLKIRGLGWKAGLLLVLPLALDGGIQLIATAASIFTKEAPFYESTNSIRAITGILFGLGLSFYLFPRLKEELGQPVS